MNLWSLFIPFSSSKLIARGICSINIEGNAYDINSLGSVKSFTYEDSTYYFNLCGALKPSDIPGANESAFIGGNIMKKVGDKYYTTNFLGQFDFGEILPGVMYSADGEPRKENDEYKATDFDIFIKCDQNSESTEFGVSKWFADSTDHFTLNFTHKSGCKSEKPKPTPTPTFEPICDFQSRWDTDPNLGIDAHFGSVDGGPYGIITPISINDSKGILYYKPCGRMECPPQYTCEDSEYSSAFICPVDQSSRDCQNFGVQQHWKSAISLYSNKESDGLLITYENQYKSKLHITDTGILTYPEGHILIDEQATLEGDTILLNGKSHEADIVQLPIPQPTGEKCKLNTSLQEVTLNVDLSTLNGGENGHNRDVNVEGMVSINNATIYYQPCGALACPKSSECGGIEDSTLYFCFDEGRCRSYSIFENNLTFTLTDPTDLNKGFRVNYYGIHNMAQVVYKCDQSVGVDELRIDPTVRFNGTTLVLQVSTPNACSNTPTPQPTPVPWRLPKPQQLSPLPTPMKSPNPVNIIQNETHYLSADLNFFEDAILSKSGPIKYRSNSADFELRYNPWNILDCPREIGICPIGRNTANAYGCSKSDDDNSYCWPYGNIIYDAEARLYGQRLEDGLELRYNSEYDTNFKLLLQCDLKTPYNLITLDENKQIEYQVSSEGKSILAHGLAQNACPREFAYNRLPETPSPTPTPRTRRQECFKYASKPFYKKYMEIDLSKFKDHDEYVILRSSPAFIKAELQIDLDQPRSCKGDVCVGGGTTNIWKCITNEGQKKCYGVGDARISLDFYSTRDFLRGITVTYGGGYDNYSTRINFVCNESVPTDEVDFDDVGFEDDKVITLTAHTNAVCTKKYEGDVPTLCPDPYEPDVTPTPTPAPTPSSKISGGGIFLILVFVPLPIYFLIGVIFNLVVYHTVSIFHKNFWLEFVVCVQTGFMFIVSCGRVTVVGSGKYEEV